jgi:lariat debranching enzyme
VVTSNQSETMLIYNQWVINNINKACPAKFRTIGTFHEYYSGKKIAPIPTVFIGGNHEASNYLWELYHGGFVAPNIYFLGHCGLINFGGLRIGGISGIYKSNHYDNGK